MEALVYTKDNAEYERLETLLREEGFSAVRDPLDGHGHYEFAYPLVVVALEGAKGMNVVREWRSRYDGTQIIWITGDPYFAGVAMEQRIHSFIGRPYEENQLRRSIQSAKNKETGIRHWHFQANKSEKEM